MDQSQHPPSKAKSGIALYDLEPRTLKFAQEVRRFVKALPRTLSNREDARQLVRASGSVGANYIEANESLGKKDFRMHIRIACKESKESAYWLKLVSVIDGKMDEERLRLVREAGELVSIFGAILRKR